MDESIEQWRERIYNANQEAWLAVVRQQEHETGKVGVVTVAERERGRFDGTNCTVEPGPDGGLIITADPA